MLGTNIGSWGKAIAAMMLAVAVASGIASASEDGRVAAARKLIMRDDELISPSALTMSHDDVLELDNESSRLMKLIFVEPQDQTDKIRCYPIDHTIARPYQAPGLLFDLGPGAAADGHHAAGEVRERMLARSRRVYVRRETSQPRSARCGGFARGEGHDHGSGRRRQRRSGT